MLIDEAITAPGYPGSEFNEPFHGMDHPLGPLLIEEAKDFWVNGTAREVEGLRFSFYVFDGPNYELYEVDKPSVSLFEAKNVAEADFRFPLLGRWEAGKFYFVVEDPEPNLTYGRAEANRLAVRTTAMLTWKERAIMSATFGGAVAGLITGGLGFLLIVAAGIAALISRRSDET